MIGRGVVESWLSWLWSRLCQQQEDPSTKEVKRFTLGLLVTLIQKVISSDTLHEIGTLGYFWLDVDVKFLAGCCCCAQSGTSSSCVGDISHLNIGHPLKGSYGSGVSDHDHCPSRKLVRRIVA